VIFSHQFCDFTTKLPDLSQFDLVTALGTLEHLDNLKKFVMKLKAMKSGARFHHFDDFGDQNISPMHYNHSRGINKWLGDAGFIIFDERWAIKGASI